jgi:hypothetical protein
MPTPSDGTPVPDRTHDEMVRQGQDAIDAQNKAVDEQRNLHETVTQSFIPNRGVPAVSGDCVLEEKYESETERTSESGSE